MPPGGAPTARPPRPAPAAPAAVGRLDVRNVVIGDPVAGAHDGTFTAGVVVDEDHPILFDHRLDHIPAMLVLEAFRQTAIVAAARTTGIDAGDLLLSACGARFDAFAELWQEAACHATVGTPSGPAIPVALELRQGDRVRCSAQMEVRSCP
jgi:2-oxo-3-(phosphooxy)propyl 3-oxoalkanoate synthase